ncbi:capsule assembly Wzi family protein [Aliikangiella sp. IMCC44653]
MKFYIKLTLYILATVLTFANPTSANAKAHYLPLKSDPLIELELEKLATIAQMPALAKPYHINTVQIYLEKIKASHPSLYQKIKHYLARYNKDYQITQLSIEGSYSNRPDKSLPNQRGRTTDSNLQASVAGYWAINDSLNLSLGANIYDGSGGIQPRNSYISYNNPYTQIDIGYKEIWLSPLQESAMLLSTNAKPIARFNISSPTPWTDYNLRYDVSFGKLEEQQGIRFEDDRFPGKPGFLTMHFSAQPLSWWTLGASRTMMFGGGEREVNLSALWEAIIDPVSGDNCGGASDLQDCNKEVGNQQASVSSKFDFSVGMPVSLYIELAGEDTNDFKAYKLGNKAYNLGFWLPYLTSNSSLLIEHQLVENAWYTHHIYQEGYRNDLSSMGHWWGNEKSISDKIGSQITSLRFNQNINDFISFDAKLVTFINKNVGSEAPSNESVYSRGHELTFGLSEYNENAVWRYELYLGRDNFGKDFSRVSVRYSWQ